MTQSDRHRRVNAARVQADLSVQQLWLRYISLSGMFDMLEVDAYLHGLTTLDSYQEDKLSYAVNERLDELHEQARLSYTKPIDPPAGEDPLRVLRELIESARAEAETNRDTPRRERSAPPGDDVPR